MLCWGIAKKNLDVIAELSSGFYSLYVPDRYFAAATNPWICLWPDSEYIFLTWWFRTQKKSNSHVLCFQIARSALPVFGYTGS